MRVHLTNATYADGREDLIMTSFGANRERRVSVRTESIRSECVWHLRNALVFRGLRNFRIGRQWGGYPAMEGDCCQRTRRRMGIHLPFSGPGKLSLPEGVSGGRLSVPKHDRDSCHVSTSGISRIDLSRVFGLGHRVSPHDGNRQYFTMLSSHRGAAKT